jgi:hypothetical protein
MMINSSAYKWNLGKGNPCLYPHAIFMKFTQNHRDTRERTAALAGEACVLTERR